MRRMARIGVLVWVGLGLLLGGLPATAGCLGVPSSLTFSVFAEYFE